MKPFRAIVVAVCVLAFALLFGSPAKAGSSIVTDMSDLYWIHTEAGWGIQIVQQETTIFATLFVYGPDGQPTWYTATLLFQGQRNDGFTWTGTLYKTTGPWFGTVPFDPASVTLTAIGSMSYEAKFINVAKLTYTVNGVQVTKAIERQVLVNERYAGLFSGVMSQQGTGATCNPAANVDSTPVTASVTQDTGVANPETRFTVTSNQDTCTFIGSYAQTGHFGQVGGNYACTGGDTGSFVFVEMARSWYAFQARTWLNSSNGCVLKGFLIGLSQPPPPQ